MRRLPDTGLSMRATEIYYTTRIQFWCRSVGRTRRGILRSSALAILIFVALPTVAQTAPASASAQSAPAWSPSKDIGVFVFGKNGQNPDQQLKDESECYGAANQMTGDRPQGSGCCG